MRLLLRTIFRKLEKDLMICESEKMVLQNKLRDIENDPSLVIRSNNSDSEKRDERDCNINNVSEQNEIKKRPNSTNIENRSIFKEGSSQLAIITSQVIIW